MLVLLDRDGVINEDIAPHGTLTPEAFQLIEGSAQAIAQLNAAGHQVAVVTNQSAIGKGLLSEEGLQAIHEKMYAALAQHNAHIDALTFCPDHPDEPTYRRKPNPGMLEEMLQHFGAKAENTPMVGDALRDMEAAAALGCPRYWVRTGKGAAIEAQAVPASVQNVTLCDNLLDAVTKLLA